MNKKQQRLVSFFYILIMVMFNHHSNAQCTEILCSNSSICANESIQFSLSDTAAIVNWDINAGDYFKTFSTSSNIYPLPAITTPRAVSFVNDNGAWYGFTYNTSLSNLYRIDFGNGIDAAPTNYAQVSYSSSASLISSSTWSSLKFINEAGVWYAYAVTEGSVLARLKFTSGLSANTVDFQIFNNTSGLGLANPLDVDIVERNDSIFLFVVNKTGSTLKVYTTGTSVLNTPLLLATHTLAGFNSLQSIDVKFDCGNYYAIFCSINDGKIGVINFGSSFTTISSFEQVSGISSSALPMKSYLVRENNQWIGWIKHATTPNLTKIFFGENLNTNADSVIQYSSLNASMAGWAFQLIEDSSRVFGLGIKNSGNRELYRLNFNQPTYLQPTFFSGNSISMAFENYGNYLVKANVTDVNGREFVITDTFNVQPAPAGAITQLSGNCDSDSFSFTFSPELGSPSVNGYNWSFALNSSTLPVFDVWSLAADTYNLEFTGTAMNGCEIQLTSPVIIHPSPNVNFTLDTVCRAAIVQPINNSTIEFDSIQTVNWIFNYLDTVYTINPEYYFLDTGLQSVTLELVSSFGCISSDSQFVYVKDGPQAAFQVSHTCFGELTEYDSSPSSSIPYNVLWEFGDGFISTLEDDVHQYSSIGSYSVKLFVFGQNGCSDSVQQVVHISNLLSSSIESSTQPVCELQEFQVVGSIIGGLATEQFWYLDTILISTLDSFDMIIPSSGEYTLQYVVNSGTSCFDTAELVINTLAKPSISIELQESCAGDSARIFSNSISSGPQSIESHFWQAANASSIDSIFIFKNENQGLTSTYYKVVTDSGCFRDTTFNVNFLQRPEIIHTPLDELLCSGIDYLIEFGAAYDSLDAPFKDSITISSSNFTSILIQPYQHISFAESGVYYLDYQLISNHSCVEKISDTVFVRKSPENKLIADTTCVSTSLKFESSYSGSNYSWAWSFGNGDYSSISEPNYAYTQPGLYNVSVLLTDKITGCYDLDSNTILVVDIPNVGLSDSVFCINQPKNLEVEISNSILDIRELNWLLDGQLVGVGKENYLVFNDTDPHRLFLEIGYNFGCNSEFEKIISGLQSPNFNMLITPTYSVTPVDVKVEFDYGLGITSMQVMDSLVAPIKSFEFTVDYPQIIDFYASVSDTNGCVAGRKLRLNYLNSFLDLSIESADVKRQFGQNVVEVKLANRGNVDITNALITLTTDQGFELRKVLSDTFFTSEFKILNFDAVSSELNSFCVSIDSVNDQIDAQIENNSFCDGFDLNFGWLSLHPNPSRELDLVNISVANNSCEEITIEVFDYTGKLITRNVFSSLAIGYNELQIGNSGFTSGLYFVLLTCADQSELKKLIVE